ncbi:MAG: class I SAM-dependent methyltransferase [Nostocaceae cyanobacterium]|nr:class I SAM-dependent methyltransferase [Nostocaceae cyanobacterium]
MQESKSKILNRDWSAYYNAVVGRPPRETLLAALEHFQSENSPKQSLFAVDLGCGDGRDTVELLRQGWRVLAIDGQSEAISRLVTRPDINVEHLEPRVMRFEQLVLPESIDLINASFALPFCPPEHFSKMWSDIVNSLRSGGRFSGQLFGDRDSWAMYTSMNHHSRSQLEKLLEPFAIEILQEEEHPGKTAIGEDKYWHIFHIVARKK